jgi:FkbM family methyltransferase
MVLKKLLKKLSSLRDPRPRTIEQWAEHHRTRVQGDVAAILQYLPDGGRFVDVGANVGLFTECVLAERPRCEAVLFEPVRAYFERCQARFADNPRIQVHHLGVGPDPGTHPIYKAKHNYGGNSMVEELIFDDRENAMTTADSQFTEEQIEVVHFSQFALEHGIGEVDFIKTDTEAFDYAVLQSMLPWLRERTRLPVILSEMLSPTYHTRHVEQAQVIADLVELGYQDVTLPTEPRVFDILFLPQGYPSQGEPAD